MIELSELHTFRAVVQAGGINKAAIALHRAQSSITVRVRQLEEKLGVPLFIRAGRTLQLSPGGKVLMGYAERLLDLAQQASEATRNDQPQGVLRLGAMESTAAVRLPQPLGLYHEMYPDVSLELYSNDPRELVRLVLDGKLDAALIADPISDKRLDAAAIYEEELVIVAEAKHPPIASPKDIPSKSILAFHPGCPHRQRIEDWFARSRTKPQRIVEVGSYHLILGCVAVGMGVALMPRSVLSTYVDRSRLSVHPLPPKYNRARTRLIWLQDSPKANIQALLRVLLKCGGMQQIVQDL
ncbi:LysR family transcriptional regulator [Verminephrobacter eiseniae]|uniref:LysR family transcriptional regulator n=1 Tax=Verminephrobacter eiseniae TaxID=364317 RepID=UPI0022378C9D|nr:LysR family transcriptional regulator [Verminephrobacter eiseniae]MCW5233405.1 LysR family transcriptional regulator [Verminephrobacter eiseniae]MCW5295042.1 LysR family transcriptional regulator [Verminephrobacter eiseniae]MCW8186065.1 LysR family transcriptional regulator [Verminephrobacter eiseniae]MCW8224909.1 LysR family transcriptional regulator [Verminephrobacter eiseniae]MCW8235959.1 LysR family transcriptional regulator [Verminephrobacter eiseniae]